ncbi:MAG: glycosyltransferase family 2 protein [Anaerolineales bacterium]
MSESVSETQPLVSILIPCYNEEKTLPALLQAIYEQTYPRSRLEVIIADGFSEDGSRQVIAEFQSAHPDLNIRLLDNPQRIIPAALNHAIRAARGEILIRLDAHSRPYPDYIERCMAALEAGQGDNVGGVWEIQPGGKGWIARAIAVAVAHPLGAGDARYRLRGPAGEVDTVPFGAFRRSLIERIGFFDETLLTNEDYEFNTRIRQNGGRVWLDPRIRSVYYARGTLLALCQQYARYGYWKWKMLRRYPRSLRWRQAIPPFFVLTMLGGALLGPFVPWIAWLWSIEIGLYLSLLLVTSLRQAIRFRDPLLIPGLILAFPCIHFSWGGAFIWSILYG